MTLTTLAIISCRKEQYNCKNENRPPFTKTKKLLREILSDHCKIGFESFYVNCEYGVPLWAAEIICDLKKKYPLKLNIVMPYEEQAKEWTEKQRERFYKIHELADSVYIANTRFHEKCYEEADEIMLQNSDALLIHGTCNQFAIDYAIKHNIHLAHF